MDKLTNKNVKIKVRKDNELYIKQGVKMEYCDFCGKVNAIGFESEYCDNVDIHKCEMQICYECVEQLHKIVLKPQ